MDGAMIEAIFDSRDRMENLCVRMTEESQMYGELVRCLATVGGDGVQFCYHCKSGIFE